MQITIRSSNIIFLKRIDEYLTKNEILEQAGISFKDDQGQPVDLSASVVLGGGAFDDPGYKITSSLRDSTILWQINLPNGQILDESANPLMLQVATSQAEFDALQKKCPKPIRRETDHQLVVANHQTITLGHTTVNKPLPNVSLKLATDYDMSTVQMVVYPVVGSGKSVNKNLVNLGDITVNNSLRTVNWSPKNQDLYPFGPNNNDITSLVYVAQAEKYLIQQEVKKSAWGFDPTQLLTDNKFSDRDLEQPALAKEKTSKPLQSKVTSKAKDTVAKPVKPINNDKLNKTEQTAKKDKQVPAKVIWYQQQVKDGIANVRSLATNVMAKAKAKAKPKKQATANKPVKPVKSAPHSVKAKSNHSLLKYAITALIGLGIAGSGTYLWREASLKPYQTQISTVESNQNQINNLLDQKPLTTNNLKKAIQLSSDNSKLIKQLPVSDNNVWRARTYNYLEAQNEALVAKAKSKIKTENNKQTAIN